MRMQRLRIFTQLESLSLTSATWRMGCGIYAWRGIKLKVESRQLYLPALPTTCGFCSRGRVRNDVMGATKLTRESNKTVKKTWRVPLPRLFSLLILLVSLLCSPRLASWANQAATFPELPRIVPDDFPPATLRDKVRVAYAAVLGNPLDASVNGKLGMVLEAYRPNDERAEACYRRAHQLEPRSFRWTYYLATVLAAQSKYEEAIATLQQALQLDTEYLPAQLKIGEYLRAEGRSEEAANVFEKIVQQHPESAQALYALGQAYESLRNLDEAVDSFRRACELFAYFGAAHYALARAYQRLGKADAAKEELARYEENKYDIPGAGDRLQAELDEIYMDPQSLPAGGPPLPECRICFLHTAPILPSRRRLCRDVGTRGPKHNERHQNKQIARRLCEKSPQLRPSFAGFRRLVREHRAPARSPDAAGQFFQKHSRLLRSGLPPADTHLF